MASSEAVASLSPEEAAVRDAVVRWFESMAACEAAGGDPQRGFLAAIPPEMMAEVKAQFPMLGFLGL